MSPARPARIRVPFATLVIPVMVAFCTLPIATLGGWWSVAYALPILVLVGVVTAGTTARASGLSARWWRGWVRIAWDDVDQIEFPGQRWAVAVTKSGRRVLLPGVRPADLPRIAAAAGSKLFLERPVDAHGDDQADADTPLTSAG